MRTRLAVIADDLSGAVEAGAGVLVRTPNVVVRLGRAADRRDHRDALDALDALDHDVVIVDTDSRSGDAGTAVSAIGAATRDVGDAVVVVKKLDSLLRGHVAAELAALRAWRPRLVVAPSLPAAGRVVRDGVLFFAGTPLHESDAWRAEGAAPPRSVAAALDPLPTVEVPLREVRGSRLAAILDEATGRGHVPVCDAVDDADLDLIVAAAAGIDQCTLAGSAALVAAVARAILPTVAGGVQCVAAESPPPTRDVVVAVGSAAPTIAAQLDGLAAIGASITLIDPRDVTAHVDASLVGRPTVADVVGDPRVTVVAVDPSVPVDGAGDPRLVAAVADRAAAAAGPDVGLVLTGGQTARAVLDRLGITSLRPLGQVHQGAVVSAADDGRRVGIRPGSFGGPSSLVELVEAVANANWPVPPAPEEIS